MAPSQVGVFLAVSCKKPAKLQVFFFRVLFCFEVDRALFGATHRSGLRIKNDSTDFLDAFSYVLESLKFGVVCHFLKLPVI